jgi:transposase
MVAAIGNGASFAKGRDFAAWLGLVPKQMSTGDRTILGRISNGRSIQLGHQRRFKRKSRTSAYAPTPDISLRRTA